VNERINNKNISFFNDKENIKKPFNAICRYDKIRINLYILNNNEIINNFFLPSEIDK